MNANRMMRVIAGLAAAGLAGCANLAPTYERPALAVPATLPSPAGADGTAVMPQWQALLQDERLRQVVTLALANSRDLRVALLNVERSRAQLRLADADRWPTISAALGGGRAPNLKGVEVNTWQAGLQLSAYEVDLLGRVRNLDDAAAASLLATEAAGRGARLALITQTATAWLALAADQEQLLLAQQSGVSRDETLRLTTLREQVGAASGLELNVAQTLSASARASVAQLGRQVAQDRNALNLLVGQTVPDGQLPGLQGLGSTEWLAPVPAGASSDLLLARPDVNQAEQQLVAANANIGAARAAMFPRITLSGSGGQVSPTLAGLVSGGSFAYTLGASAAMALFDAGRNQASIQVAQVNRDMAVAQYEKAVQTAFREAADALVAQASWHEQVRAQLDLLDAERERTRLTRLKLTHGAASLTDVLDAERSLVAAQQGAVQARLGEWLNRLALYKALGGGEDQPR